MVYDFVCTYVFLVAWASGSGTPEKSMLKKLKIGSFCLIFFSLCAVDNLTSDQSNSGISLTQKPRMILLLKLARIHITFIIPIITSVDLIMYE